MRLLCLLWLPAQAAALNAFFAAAGPKSAPKQQLLDLCKDSNYGVEAIDRNRLDELIDAVVAVLAEVEELLLRASFGGCKKRVQRCSLP